jgi:hypothetical protein
VPSPRTLVQEVLIRAHVRWNRIGAMDRPEDDRQRVLVLAPKILAAGARGRDGHQTLVLNQTLFSGPGCGRNEPAGIAGQ